MSPASANRTEGASRAGRAQPPGALPTFAHQIRYDLLSQVRNPAAMFFSLGLPLIFLVTFTLIGGDWAETAGYYTPATMTIAIVTGTMTNLAITLSYLREYGQLKRLQLLPVPRSALLGSRMAAACVLALAGVAVVAVFSAAVYDTTPEQPGRLAAAILLLGVAGSVLGVALTAVIPSENAASPIANALVLPLLMISGGFFPLDGAPEWVRTVSSLLPLEPGLSAAVDAYRGACSWSDIGYAALVTGAWTAATAALGVRFFSWTPRHRR
ncbi:ABC transporter permease [Allosalinactinospora lopnorensis]|uniref:ABC transporter permease n=1 Tax=Allosalinactinospora lopnorensis TaxID=1352348 RepID=UPI000623D6DC|nr:ABC transporter permease [Allosalinactinospora lopnorensis]